MNLEPFLDKCQKNKYSKKDIASFREAIEFAKLCLAEKIRKTNEPAVNHNIRLGEDLIEAKLSPEIVVAGLLYGVERFTAPSELQKKFGTDVADLVYGQLKLKDIKSKSQTGEADIIRQVLLVTLDDIRILFVKLADKLDNLRTIEVLSAKEQKRIAEEVLDIYAPLAGRLGAETLKKKLVDKAFEILNPNEYKKIQNFLKASKEEREKFIHNFTREITRLIKTQIKTFAVTGREKQIYSIYEKIVKRKIPLEEQKDHFAIRVITNSVEECYTVLGILHKNYESVPGTLKDYITNPKENGYKSLHTILKLGGKHVEVQVRTKEMHEFNEEGAAAHWNYKKLKSDFGFEKKIGWLREIFELQKSDKTKEFLKTVKLNVFGDKFYCYTPKGNSICLPRGATVLDFAYYIHQDIGDKAVGGRINGVFASLRKELKSGDIVEILTNRYQHPRRDWIKFVVSSRAKSYIKKGVKKYEDLPITSRTSLTKIEKEDFDKLVVAEGFPNHTCILAKCCSPVPKNEIIGIVKSHKRILVHTKTCSRIEKDTKNFVLVEWQESFNRPIKIFVEAEDRSGILADILNTMARAGFITKEARAKMLGNGLVECVLIIVPQELNEVAELIKRVKKVRGVKKIEFE